MKAHIYLKKDPACLLIAGAADFLSPIGNIDIMGFGPFVNLLENTTKTKAKILGKPGQELIDYIKSKYSIENPRKVLFVGDSLSSDVKFGKMLGFQTLLIISEFSKISDMENCTEDEKPDYYTDSVADFKDFC